MSAVNEPHLAVDNVADNGIHEWLVRALKVKRIDMVCVFFFQAEDGIRDLTVTGVQTCALPIFRASGFGRCYGIWPRNQALPIPNNSLSNLCSCMTVCPCPHRWTTTSAPPRQRERSEERRVGKEGRSRWSPDH